MIRAAWLCVVSTLKSGHGGERGGGGGVVGGGAEGEQRRNGSGPPSGRDAGLKWTDYTGPARGLAAVEAIERRAHSKHTHTQTHAGSVELAASCLLLSVVATAAASGRTSSFSGGQPDAQTQREFPRCEKVAGGWWGRGGWGGGTLGPPLGTGMQGGRESKRERENAGTFPRI